MEWERCRVLVDTVCFGGSMLAAGVAAGVSRPTARKWFRRSAGLPVRFGRHGGIAGPVMRWSVIAAAAASVAVARRRRPLTGLEREVIAIRHHGGATVAAIGRELGRHRSVIWRELKRNSGPDGSYFGSAAAVRAAARARRPKPFKLQDRVLAGRVSAWLEQGWSPRLIAEVLAVDAGGDQTARVSHETIYQAL